MSARNLFVMMFALAACGSSSTGDGPGDGPGAGGVDGGGSGSSTGSDGSTGSSNATGCKRGLAYGANSPADLAALSPGVGWWYNWALAPDKGVASAYQAAGFEYVPMVWGSSTVPTASAAITGDEKFLLTFNEPDFNSQANLTPQQAAALWPQIEQTAAAHKLAIVSPALNYCGGGCNETNPFDWFDAFFAACKDCKVDYLAVHWYACTKDALTNYIGMMKKYGKPIWLTEFACLDGGNTALETEQTYMRDALTYLESEPAVVRYSWFTGRFPKTSTIDLLGADGQLTALGQQYVSAPGACTK
jgi:hypothetical protein